VPMMLTNNVQRTPNALTKIKNIEFHSQDIGINDTMLYIEGCSTTK